MASISNLIRVHTQSMKFTDPRIQFQVTKSLHYPTNHHLAFFSLKHINSLKTHPLSLHCSFSSSSPPTSKEAAILQAKTCISTTLEKPLNNPKLTGKLKKQKQPRFRIEIPVIDDSPDSLSELALDVFGNMPIKRKGSYSKFNLVIIWPNHALTNTALKSYSSNQVNHIDISSATNTTENSILKSADVAVFLAPDSSQLAVIETVTDILNPKPVVIFNPKWVFEDESNFGEKLRSFVGSFDVLYSFMGLEVKGIFSKKNGIVFKCVENGILSGEKWNVFVEEDGQMKVVSRFKERPPISEVENVLYNLMAINSPITKSAKFFKDLASNITGKK